MSQVTQSKEIGDKTFTVTQLDGWKGLDMLPRLAAIAAPAIERFLAESGNEESRWKAVAGAGAALLQRLTPQELNSIAKELLANAQVTINGKTQQLMPIFSIAMQGKPWDTLQLVWFAIMVNYGNFGEGSGGLLAHLQNLGLRFDASSISKAAGQGGDSSSSA